ncbi:MAG TPA: cytochrome c oxidase subunit I [Iamia sp.]|nr:cytochrome c oxidase subunit I [Iamia sp.]
MTTVEEDPRDEIALTPPEEEPDRPPSSVRGRGLLGLLTSTDHKVIGLMYIVTALLFFLLGGALATVVRVELYSPGTQVVEPGAYNQVFTMHGSVMIYLFITPVAFGLANYLVPLQIGAKEMAFPRLNALGYWLFLFGGLTMVAGFLTADGPAAFGWTAYAPLSEAIRSPAIGHDLWLLAIVLTGTGTVTAAVNVVATVLAMRAPGMSMFRMPIFTWNMLVTSVLALIAFPVLTSAAVMMLADRNLDAQIFNPEGGGHPVLWQHLFWFFGHPEVYIVALPFFGIVTEVLAVFSSRPVFGYRGLVLATFAIASLSVGVWGHHMFTTGDAATGYFSGLSLLIAVPTGVKFFNWIGTMWGGRLRFPTPMLFTIGFLLLFVMGGVTGVLLALPALDFQLHDSYFVVAHFHYVMFGGSAFALYAGIYYWFPKATGRLLHEGWGRVHFVMTFVGFNVTFLVQHWLGAMGMPRRVADYLPEDGFTLLNRVSTVGAIIMAASVFPLAWNIWRSLRRGEPAGDDPWHGHTLEWATTSPPPPHNFDHLPPIRSNRPVWDERHPEHREVAHR